jgi:hypothetical protein
LLLQIGGYIIHTDLHQAHINDFQVYPIMSVVHIGIVRLAAVLAAAAVHAAAVVLATETVLQHSGTIEIVLHCHIPLMMPSK